MAYYHADGLGSIVKMTDQSGATLSNRLYDTWGNLQLGADQPGFSFTGREWDPEINLYYYRARYYDPKLGPFISEDPIGFNADVNFYAYVDSDPAGATDSFGLWKSGGHRDLTSRPMTTVGGFSQADIATVVKANLA